MTFASDLDDGTNKEKKKVQGKSMSFTIYKKKVISKYNHIK